MNVKRQDAHAKPARNSNHVQPDVPGADHSDRFALQIESRKLGQVHPAAAHLQNRLMNFPGQHQQQRNGVLGHGIFAVRWDVGNGDTPGAAGLHVNVVKSGRARGNEFQFRQLVQHLTRHM